MGGPSIKKALVNLKTNTYICNMEDKKVVRMGQGKGTPAEKTKVEAVTPVEVETIPFAPANAEELVSLLKKLPTSVLDYKQFSDISELNKKLDEIITHYRTRARDILTENGLEQLVFSKAESDAEKRAAQQVSLEYSTDCGVITESDLKVLSEDTFAAIIGNPQNTYTFGEIKALQSYLKQ